MNKIIDGKREIFICDCHSLEHQYSFWYDEEDNELWFEPHLYDNTWPWYKRFWNRIKYVFGSKTVYGAWDSTIIKVDDIPRLTEFMNKVISEDKIRERKIIRPDPSVGERDVDQYDPILNNDNNLDDEN